MKTISLTPINLAAIVLLGLLCGPAASRAQLPPSPVGLWDCRVTGTQDGLAVLSFNGDQTITGFLIARPVLRRVTTPDFNPRYPNGVPGRIPLAPPTGGSSGDPTTISSTSNFLGSAGLVGRWAFDVNRRVVGLLSQNSRVVEAVESVTTNIVDGELVISTNFTLAVKFTTNFTSFRATVAPGQRLTMSVYSTAGNNVFRGLPAADLSDLTGNYYADGVRATVPFIEFLEFEPKTSPGNYYNLNGVGPGYDYTGQVLLSKHKYMALLTLAIREEPLLAVYTGPYNAVTRRGSFGGHDNLGQKYSYKLFPQ